MALQLEGSGAGVGPLEIPHPFLPDEPWYTPTLQSLYRSVVPVSPGALPCDTMHEGHTFFVQRYHPDNLYDAVLTLYAPCLCRGLCRPTLPAYFPFAKPRAGPLQPSRCR